MKRQSTRPWFGPDDTAECVALGDAVRAKHAWGDETHPLFQEYVAREHLDGGMPVVELHRNHGLPLSAVRRWIATYRDGGRAALEREALEKNAKTKKRDDALAAKGAKPEELDALRTSVAGNDLAAQRAAYATIKKRRLVALVPAIVDAVRKADKIKDRSVQEELELLAALKAKHALHELLTSKLRVMRGYSSWMSGLFRKAGCEIKTVNEPWSEHYELDGKWFRIPR